MKIYPFVFDLILVPFLFDVCCWISMFELYFNLDECKKKNHFFIVFIGSKFQFVWCFTWILNTIKFDILGINSNSILICYWYVVLFMNLTKLIVIWIIQFYFEQWRTLLRNPQRLDWKSLRSRSTRLGLLSPLNMSKILRRVSILLSFCLYVCCYH
jgi:hypothetical protein